MKKCASGQGETKERERKVLWNMKRIKKKLKSEKQEREVERKWKVKEEKMLWWGNHTLSLRYIQ